MQVLLAEDQDAVQELAAQGADQALADRVHARRLDSGTQDPGTGGLEHGVERGGEVRSAVTDQELDVLEPLAEGEGEVAGRWVVHWPVGLAVTPPRCIRRVPCSMNTRTYSRFSSTVSTWKKSTARIRDASARRNCRQVGPARRGAGSMPAERRISQTVDGATATPSFVTSPWIRRYPTTDSPSPAGQQGGRCWGPSAVGRACAGCSRRTYSQPACGTRPAASLASRGRLRASSCAE